MISFKIGMVQVVIFKMKDKLMAQYIDKDAVVAEIERRLSLLENGTGDSEVMKRVDGVIKGYKSILYLLDAFDVKEVDLKEEINDFLNEEYRYTEYEGKWVDEKDWRDSIQRCARHFYELGLKTKEE